MKVLVLIVIMFSFGFTFNNEKLDKCNGIDSFTFGSKKENYKNLSLEIEEGSAQLYNANSNAIHIDGVELEFIRVTFTKNKLSAISLSTKNGTRSAFFNYLKTNYGAPVKFKNRFEWSGKKVSIVFELYNYNKDAAIDFYTK